MKIAFISTRGIPNNYGGFEQFAEYISVGLAKRGHEVTVYSPSFHPYMEDNYKGVRIKHIYSPEIWMGSSVGSFFYDFSSLKDALKPELFQIIFVEVFVYVRSICKEFALLAVFLLVIIVDAHVVGNEIVAVFYCHLLLPIKESTYHWAKL